MRSMEIDRRRFLICLGGCAALAGQPATVFASGRDMAASLQPEPAGPDGNLAASRISDALFLAARKSGNRYEAVLMDGAGADRRVVPLEGRGHSFAIDVLRRRAVAFGRQPGFFAVAFDLAGKAQPITLRPAPGRHFFGHGVFSPDGDLLIATENDYEAGRGVLGIYDASSTGAYRRVGEYDCGGIGAHEVILMPDGRTLCVANGGILTHPDYGKLQLNADTMASSLAYIDMRSGALLEQHRIPQPWQRLSLRHLTVDRAGAVWFGCQYTGPAQDRPPLVGRHRRGQALEWFTGPDEVLRGMKNYVGSLSCDASGTTVATSSPVGGKIVLWDARSGQYRGSVDIFDGCGVAPGQGEGFVITSGQGTVYRVHEGVRAADAFTTPAILDASADRSWDNHLRRL